MIAGLEVQNPRCLRSQEDTVFIRQPALDMPPGFQDAGGVEVDPRHQDPATVDGHHAQHHRAQRGDVAGVSDGGEFGQLGFTDLLELEGNATHGHSAVGERKVLSAGNDQDIGTVLFEFVGDIVGRGVHEADDADHRRDTDRQPGQDEGRLALAAHEVPNGDELECHRISPSWKNRNSPCRPGCR